MCNITFEIPTWYTCLKNLQKKDIHNYIRGLKEPKGFWLEFLLCWLSVADGGRTLFHIGCARADQIKFKFLIKFNNNILGYLDRKVDNFGTI